MAGRMARQMHGRTNDIRAKKGTHISASDLDLVDAVADAEAFTTVSELAFTWVKANPTATTTSRSSQNFQPVTLNLYRQATTSAKSPTGPSFLSFGSSAAIATM
eukprot:scaffold373533_cov37-Prasinocladus_malaysianus.AAC.1